MRGFLFLCLVATSTAAQLGYNYQQIGQNAEFGSGLLGGVIDSSGNIGTITIGDLNASGGGGIAANFDSGFGGFNGLNEAHANNVQTGFPSAVTSSHAHPNDIKNNGGLTASEYNKEFYTYSAPDDEFNDHAGSQHIAASLKKNLRVVFIKAPENQALANAALQLAKQASEDRTAIYVLNKQSDIGDLANQLQTLKASGANRPEVHFVKYRTPEDAARAQQTIQAQYETLGGQTHSSNEGVAPVLNFASPATGSSGGRTQGTGGVGSGLGGAAEATGTGFETSKNGYLPPALRLK